MSSKGEEAPPARPIRARATELQGSNAGAGSGVLAVYRKHRRVEMERIEAIEKEQEAELKAKQTREVLDRNAAIDAARVEKNRRKRQRRKAGKGSHHQEESGSGNEEEAQLDLDEEAKALQELAEAELNQVNAEFADQQVSN